MQGLQSAVLVVGTVFAGLMAGLFAAFSYAVMPGLGRGSDRTFVEGMRGINRVILNGWFMVPFVGTVPLLGGAVVLAWRGEGRAVLPWVIVALVLYVVAFGVTGGVNVPLNDALERDAAVDGADLAGVRERFERRWVVFNVVRAVLHTAVFAVMVWALVVYGRDTSGVGVANDAAAAVVRVR